MNLTEEEKQYIISKLETVKELKTNSKRYWHNVEKEFRQYKNDKYSNNGKGYYDEAVNNIIWLSEEIDNLDRMIRKIKG